MSTAFVLAPPRVPTSSTARSTTTGKCVGAVQIPAWQVSVCVQRTPSLHVVPLALAGFEQTPVVGAHVPTAWHWSVTAQTIGLVPTQAPAWQRSVCVQAFSSLQAVPSGAPTQLGDGSAGSCSLKARK